MCPDRDYVTYGLLRDNDIGASSGPDDACAKTHDQLIATTQPKQVEAHGKHNEQRISASGCTARQSGALVYPHRHFVTYGLLRDSDIGASSGPDDAYAKTKQTINPWP